MCVSETRLCGNTLALTSVLVHLLRYNTRSAALFAAFVELVPCPPSISKSQTNHHDHLCTAYSLPTYSVVIARFLAVHMQGSDAQMFTCEC